MPFTDRRDFLKQTTTSLATAGLAAGVARGAGDDGATAGVPRRKFGRADEKVSMLCLGGHHIGTLDEKVAIAMMHEAIDEGLTFFDNAWDYHQGGSEEVMGKALSEPSRRDKVFLMTKNCARDYEGTKRHLEDSLRRLKTDRIDLWQFHEINYDNDPNWIFNRGAFKAALEARQAGKVRYIGFTGHKLPEIHVKMLDAPREIGEAADFEWDSVQMPINILDANYRSFQNGVLPKCVERGIAGIGMKSLGGGAIPKAASLSVAECQRYALSQPVSTLVVGLTSPEELRAVIQVAREFEPYTEEEMAQMRKRTQIVAGDGRYEKFKSTQNFDGKYHQRQHGFAT